MGLPGHLLHLFRQAPSKPTFLRSLALGGRGGDRTVTSSDGTPLSVRRQGRGEPVVLVHGTMDGIGAFSLVEPFLAEDFAVWVYDRRGRGGSGDAAEHSLEREIDDLEAVLAEVAAPAHVVGHSFGGLIALAAAAGGTKMRSLAVYEAPLMGGRMPAAAADVREALAAGEPERAVRTAAIRLAGVSEEELAIARAVKPVWRSLLDGVQSTPRELDVVRTTDWGERLPAPLRDLPALYLRGDRETSPVYPRLDEIPRFLGEAEVVTLRGQGHLATTFAPYDVLAALRGFLRRH